MITDLKAFCRLFYASFAIPVSYYHISSGDSCSFPAVLGDQSLFKNPPSGFFHFHQNPDYFISEVVWIFREYPGSF